MQTYHDFSCLGLTTLEPLSPLKRDNQRIKQDLILSMMLKAFSRIENPSFCELFCADAFYSMVAARFGASNCVAVDKDASQLEVANVVLAKLGLSSLVKTIQQDISKFEGSFDVVLNAGGLYHVDNPEEVLVNSYEMANRFLIVQTAVSLATNDPDYFETPAPGWTWGSRYSVTSFNKLIDSFGWNVVEQHFRVFSNPRLEDKGGLFYLIKK
jgi:hypothetical protein